MKYEALDFFEKALTYVQIAGLNPEIEYTRQLRFDAVNDEKFLIEYAFVVISSGMKNQVAQRIFGRFNAHLDPSVIGHPGKREAIARAVKEHHEWLMQLRAAPDKLAYLESLPWIGGITKYHLARNLGLDYVKPDRHLVRLATKFGYPDPATMCADIASEVGERIGVVDVILWRYSNLTGTLTGTRDIQLTTGES
jgi:hypothetical protein